MVERIYVEKQPAFAQEATSAFADIRNVLGLTQVNSLSIINRYDVEGVDHALFSSCRYTVFAEPQIDVTYDEIPQGADASFAVSICRGSLISGRRLARSASRCFPASARPWCVPRGCTC